MKNDIDTMLAELRMLVGAYRLVALRFRHEATRSEDPARIGWCSASANAFEGIAAELESLMERNGR